MVKKNITEAELRQIIRQELLEVFDYEGARDVVTAASKLIGAIIDFESSAGESVVSSLGEHLGNMKQALESMISNPLSYVEADPQTYVQKTEAQPFSQESEGDQLLREPVVTRKKSAEPPV